ncbi:MAG TPA: hypothetical protein GX406_04750 [Pseudoclavibacter sp.]|nr:hypothetical protein [Pseudoclavibacter sp.]
MRTWRALVSAALALALCGTGVPATAEEDASAESLPQAVTVSFTQESIDAFSGVDLDVSVTAGATAISGATATLSLRHIVLTDAQDIEAWLTGETTGMQWGGDLQVDDYEIPDTDAGQTSAFVISATRAQLSLGDLYGATGFVPFVVIVTTADGQQQRVTGVVPWNQGESVGDTTVVVPITAPTTSTELYTEDELTDWVASDGIFARMSEALAGTTVVIAIDAKIVASITANDSTGAAAAWLAALQDEHPVVPLSYGNGSTTALVSAGAETVPTVDSSVTGWAGSTTIWTEGDTLDADTASALTSAGYTSAVVSSQRVTNLDWQTSYSLAGLDLIISDSSVSTAIEQVLSGAVSDPQYPVALRASVTDPGVDRLVVVPTTWNRQASTLRAILQAFASASWTELSDDVSISTSSEANTTAATLSDSTGTMVDADQLSALVAQSKAADVVAGAIADSSATTVRTSLDRTLMTLSSPDWPDQSRWATELQTAIQSAQTTAGAVQLGEQASVRLISSESRLPVAIVNNLSYPVTVTVVIKPSNGRLVVEEVEPITIEAHSTTQILVPVRAVANGDVTLDMQIVDESGNTIGTAVTRDMSVSAEWESVTAGIFALAIALLFGFGLFKGILRHLRGRGRTDSSATSEKVSADAHQTGSTEPAPADTPAPGTEETHR